MSATAWEITSFFHFKRKITYPHSLVQISRTVQCYPAEWRWRVMSSVTSPFRLHTQLAEKLCLWGHPEHLRLSGKRDRRKTQSWPHHCQSTGESSRINASESGRRKHESLWQPPLDQNTAQDTWISLLSMQTFEAATGSGVDSGSCAGVRHSLSGKLPGSPAPSTADPCSVHSKTKAAQFFFQFTNSLWTDAAGNRHPAEIINKHFVPKLWILHLFWKRGSRMLRFRSSAALTKSITVPDTSIAQSCHDLYVVDATPAEDFTVPTPFFVLSK